MRSIQSALIVVAGLMVYVIAIWRIPTIVEIVGVELAIVLAIALDSFFARQQQEAQRDKSDYRPTDRRGG